MDKAVFFICSSEDIGLTTHFSRQIVDMYSYGKTVEFDTYCVSDKKEQNEGNWEYVRKHIPSDSIIAFDDCDYDSLKESLNQRIRTYEKVIIHFQGFTQLLKLRSLLKEKAKVKACITIHAFPNTQFLRKYIWGSVYNALICRYIDKAIFLSPFSIRNFVGHKELIRKGKVVHIPFNLPEQTIYGTNKWLNTDQFNVVYLANFFRNKGHERFFPAFESFAQRHEDVAFYFFGEGERKEKVEALIREKHLEKQIHCPGRVPHSDIPAIWQYAKLSLVLSKTETAGHAALEPALAGVPLIGTRVGFSEYLIQDYITGFGVGSVKELENIFEYAYSNYDKVKAMASTAQLYARTIFNYQAMLEGYYNLYKGLISE